MENNNDNDMPHSYVEDKSSWIPFFILVLSPILLQHFGHSATVALIVTAILYVLSLYLTGELIY